MSGVVWYGLVRQLRHGEVRPGMLREVGFVSAVNVRLVQRGKAWLGLARCGLAGMVRYGEVRYGLVC